jgi:hypothetical protein
MGQTGQAGQGLTRSDGSCQRCHASDLTQSRSPDFATVPTSICTELFCSQNDSGIVEIQRNL